MVPVAAVRVLLGPPPHHLKMEAKAQTGIYMLNCKFPSVSPDK
jgi:hypothetical protein